MKIRLSRFKVTAFKSVPDSGWIDVDDANCLVGVNESGKTNLLLALWKLNPANDEPILPLDDYPRKRFVDFKDTKGEEIFIEAEFSLDDESVGLVKKEWGKSVQAIGRESFERVSVSRDYNGEHHVKFIGEALAEKEIPSGVVEHILHVIPRFVYYSDYGNIDSEIYLPHVIEDFEREDLSEQKRAKVRSLKVLFDFVRLSPKEILDLGKEQGFDTSQGRPSDATIESEREKKKQREILLQSASNKLTEGFREWWKQGDYQFRFQADGNHFRIWVRDDLRPEEVELEGRSRGLQWFFSFFLVFLVESGGEHSECILLLDEPGLSLHPLAQLDLIQFFASLSKDNQIIYTTHSPFLVNPDNLSEVRAVYVDEKGKSLISSNLRQNEDVASKSIYPIHAAIGLTVSETLLLGCSPVLVEGPSDQIYLQLIKNYLIESSDYRPGRETVFIPSGGVKGMSSIISIVMGREGELPYVVLDSDAVGSSKEKNLRENLYNKEQHKLITIREVAGDGFEVEDILPTELIAQAFSRRFRARKGEDFDRISLTDEPIVSQMERFAAENGIDLELGWKVEVAREFQRIFRENPTVGEEHQEGWAKIFSRISTIST